MDEKTTQWFVLFEGVFVPIIDNVVRDGAYIVDPAAASDEMLDALGYVADYAVIDLQARLVLWADKCGYFLRVESVVKGDMTVTVDFG